MTEPMNVAGCGECFETFVEPVIDNYAVVDEVQIHQESTGHRQDVTFGQVD